MPPNDQIVSAVQVFVDPSQTGGLAAATGQDGRLAADAFANMVPVCDRLGSQRSTPSSPTKTPTSSPPETSTSSPPETSTSSPPETSTSTPETCTSGPPETCSFTPGVGGEPYDCTTAAALMTPNDQAPYKGGQEAADCAVDGWLRGDSAETAGAPGLTSTPPKSPPLSQDCYRDVQPPTGDPAAYGSEPQRCIFVFRSRPHKLFWRSTARLLLASLCLRAQSLTRCLRHTHLELQILHGTSRCPATEWSQDAPPCLHTVGHPSSKSFRMPPSKVLASIHR